MPYGFKSIRTACVVQPQIYYSTIQIYCIMPTLSYQNLNTYCENANLCKLLWHDIPHCSPDSDQPVAQPSRNTGLHFPHTLGDIRIAAHSDKSRCLSKHVVIFCIVTDYHIKHQKQNHINSQVQ